MHTIGNRYRMLKCTVCNFAFICSFEDDIYTWQFHYFLFQVSYASRVKKKCNLYVNEKHFDYLNKYFFEEIPVYFIKVELLLKFTIYS